MTATPCKTVRWLRWIAGGAAIVAAALVATYVGADFSRGSLDDETRTALTQSGRADQFVRVHDGNMHVRVSGPKSGPVVLLIHGGVIGGFAFRNWTSALNTAGYRTIVPDLLGYGYSDRPDRPYSKEFYVEQISQLIDALGVSDKVHVVGASLGGAIATAVAARMPARIRSVTLIAPAGGGRGPIVSDWLMQPVIGDWAFRVLGPTLTRRMMAAAYPPSPEQEALVAWMDEQGRFRGFGEGLLNTLRHYDSAWQPDAYQALGHSKLPVLVLWGTEDNVNPFAQSATLSQWTPQMELIALPGKPHAITFGDAPLLLKHVLPFLATQSRP